MPLGLVAAYSTASHPVQSAADSVLQSELCRSPEGKAFLPKVDWHFFPGKQRVFPGKQGVVWEAWKVDGPVWAGRYFSLGSGRFIG